MLLPDEIFRIALLTVLMGFAGTAAYQTFEVWRRRTAVVAGRTPRPLSTAERFALVFAAAGAIAMVASIGFRTALDRDGHLVASPDGVRVWIEVPTREVEDLRAAGPVAIDLIGPGFVERRLSGSMVDAEPAPDRPTRSIVEFTGQAGPDVMSELIADGTTPVQVELKWFPPMRKLPLFRTGVGLALVAGLLFLAARAGLAVPRAEEDPA